MTFLQPDCGSLMGIRRAMALQTRALARVLGHLYYLGYLHLPEQQNSSGLIG